MIASAILSTVIPAAMAQDAPGISTFTPLDAIDRVRREECVIDAFPTFLEWYAGATHTGRWLEEVVFTDYMVRVGRMNDPKGSAQMIDRQDYLGQFRITSRDYRAGEAAGAATPDARRITLKRFAPDRYRVDWQGGPGFAGVEGADRFARGRAYVRASQGLLVSDRRPALTIGGAGNPRRFIRRPIPSTA